MNVSQRAILQLKSRAKSLQVSSNPVRWQRDDHYYKWRLQQLNVAIERAAANNGMENVRQEYLLASAEIICTTLNCCPHLMDVLPSADICIMDEATQLTEPNTLLPLRLGLRAMVLVGDSRQRPCTAHSRLAGELGLDRSLFERMRSAFEPHTDACPLFRLHRQYRMQAAICAWPNGVFYDNLMETDPCTAEAGEECLLRPYTLFGMRRRQSANESIVRMLQVLGPYVQHFSIGVITSFTRQRDELLEELKYVVVLQIIVSFMMHNLCVCFCFYFLYIPSIFVRRSSAES